MPSVIQIQRPREEARLADREQGIRLASIQSRIDSISLAKAGGKNDASRNSPFDFDVELDEVSRTSDSLRVKYAFTFGIASSGQICKVGGVAVLCFSGFDPEADFHSLGNDITNEMAVEIFRKNYESVYLLHDALGMEAPSPLITQGVSLSSRAEAESSSDDI
jgi:hypothetical protein